MRIWKPFSTLLTLVVVLLSVTAWSMRSTVATVPGAGPSTHSPRAEAAGSAMDVNLFRNIAHRVNPAVVAIMTRSRVDASAAGDDVLGWLFDRPHTQAEHRLQRGLGSGFIISKDGDILTNNHVVEGAESIEVALFGDDTKTHRARIIGRDPLSDSALIRLQDPPRDLPVATLGDSGAIEPGDWVMAIGNPFQLGHTVTVGIVSYLGRPFELQEGRWQKMIQTDASINPGNSGGPLLNVAGEVVGINAAILGAGSGGNIGIGFAVPINTVTNLLPKLRSGKVVHGRIGIQVRNGPITTDDADALGLPDAQGALITAVERGSPADRGGLRAGDVIVAFNGKPVTDGDELVALVGSTRPGVHVPVTVSRDGRKQTLDLAVEELVLDNREARPQHEAASGELGLTLGDITPSIANQLALPRGVDGAVVYGVSPDGAADRAGLMDGDVIRSVNRHVVHSAGDAIRQLHEIRPLQPVFLLVWRNGNEMLVQMRRES